MSLCLYHCDIYQLLFFSNSQGRNNSTANGNQPKYHSSDSNRCLKNNCHNVLLSTAIKYYDLKELGVYICFNLSNANTNHLTFRRFVLGIEVWLSS